MWQAVTAKLVVGNLWLSLVSSEMELELIPVEDRDNAGLKERLVRGWFKLDKEWRGAAEPLQVVGKGRGSGAQ